MNDQTTRQILQRFLEATSMSYNMLRRSNTDPMDTLTRMMFGMTKHDMDLDDEVILAEWILRQDGYAFVGNDTDRPVLKENFPFCSYNFVPKPEINLNNIFPICELLHKAGTDQNLRIRVKSTFCKIVKPLHQIMNFCRDPSNKYRFKPGGAVFGFVNYQFASYLEEWKIMVNNMQGATLLGYYRCGSLGDVLLDDPPQDTPRLVEEYLYDIPRLLEVFQKWYFIPNPKYRYRELHLHIIYTLVRFNIPIPGVNYKVNPTQQRLRTTNLQYRDYPWVCSLWYNYDEDPNDADPNAIFLDSLPFILPIFIVQFSGGHQEFEDNTIKRLFNRYQKVDTFLDQIIDMYSKGYVRAIRDLSNKPQFRNRDNFMTNLTNELTNELNKPNLDKRYFIYLRSISNLYPLFDTLLEYIRTDHNDDDQRPDQLNIGIILVWMLILVI